MKFRKKNFANFADRGKRILALTLVTALSVTGNGVESFAAKPDSVSDGGKAYVYLEKATMPEEIQQNDVFYVATTSAEFMESSEKSYVLTVGRGGEAKEASHVTVKLSDGTAKYGEDYTVRRMEDVEELPENPDSVNLFELMDQGEYEGEIPYSEEDMKTAVNQIVEETSGSFKASQEEKKSTSDNPLQQAKEELTGISSDREAMTGSGNDMIEMMSQVSNLLTETVAGTTLKLDFSPGEKEKEIVITPKDNRKSDGDRFFYLVLSEPSEGMKNSSISESIFTIKDDEPEVKASISFDVESFRAENGEVQVRLIREGALTQTVAVHMTSKDGSAKAGENYEGVDSEVVFPFGVKERNLTFTAKSDGLKTDADYTLSIKESSGAVTGEVAEAKVVIPKETKVKRVKASDRGKKISDVRLGNPITEFEKVLSDTGQKGATWESYSESSGKHSFDVTSEKQIYLYGYDNAAGSGGNGVVQANSRLIDDVQMKDSDRKDSLVSTYDGVRINWKVKRSGIIPSIIWSVYASDTTGTTDVGKQLYESKKTGWDEDWREDDFIFGMEDVFSWGFRNRTEDYTEEVWIKKVTPILRPFKVRLTEPEPVELYTGEVDANGVPRTSKNQEAVATTLAGSSDGNPVMKYDGDTIVIQNSLPVNLQTVKMVGAKIVKTNSENRTAEKSTLINPEYIQINQNTGIIELNNAFVREYRDYISFADMEGSVGDKQPSTIHRKYGYFNIQPVYGKTMTQGVTVNENTAVRDSSGKTVPVKIFLNGKEVTYGEKMTGYGIGDKLTFTAQCSDETYRVTGMDVDYYSEGNKRGESGTMNADPVDHDVKLTITTDYGYVFTPTIQSNDNKMVIRVREEDLSRFEATGFFTEENLAAHSAKNETYGYREIVVADADALQSVKEIYLAVEPKSGTVPVWKLTNVNRWVMGNSYLARNQGSYGSNIIWLYAGDTSGKTTKLSGSLYYENRSVGSSFSVDPVLPVAGGVLFCGSASGVSDEDGTVETGSFVLPDSAMVYDNSMKLVKQSFDSLNKQNYLYVQATATVNANSGGHVVNLNYNGTTQLGQLVIPVNTSSSSAYVFDRVEVTNDGLSTSYMHMNGIPSTIKARVRGVSSAAANEHIKKVELLVIDRTTYAEKTSYEMAEDLSSAGDYTLTVTFDKEGYDVSSYEEGDLLFLRMTTDKKQELLSDNDMPDDVRKKLEETTYEMVNTGFMLTKTGEPAEPIVQTMDFDDMPGMDNIPLCNSLDANFKLGPVKVSLETLKDENGNAVGQRIQAGLDPEKFAEKFAYDKDDNPNGMTWDGTQKGAIGKKVNKLKQIKGNYNKAKSALSGNSSLSSDALAKKAASLGAKQWGVFPAIGFYMDFGKVAEYDEETGAVKSTSYVLQGGGIYLGASAKFAVNWYAIIPVVYIPCYFGVSGELSFMNTFTGYNPKTGHQTAPDEYLMSSHNVTKDLEYNYQLDVGATVQVYAGIGLCGVLGVRGGMSVSAEVLWYPTLHVAKDYFDETGENVTVTFYMEVDILIGTIQIASWCPADENWGLLKQIEQFDGMTEEEIDALFPPEQNETLANPVKKAKDFTEKATAAYALKERTKAAKWSGQVKELSPTMMYPASDIENSGSAAMKQIQRLRASFEEESSTLLKNDYDHPDTKLLDMGDDGTLMVFLQNDDTKSDAEFTSLSYVVYKNGEFVTEPVKIQTDKTADFQPDVCDAGKDVIFTWISSPDGTEMSGKDGWKEGDGNLAKYLLKQEIYTVRVPKTTLTAGGAIDQSTIVRLTDDESYPLGGETQFFDANPKIAYDETSGSYCIYYVKTGYDKNAKLKSPTDLANPMNTSGETYSAIVFRIYDNEKGEWVTDDVKSGENMGRYADAPDAYKELIKQAGGQRFLQSVLVDGAISKADPLIADFTAFSSQGYAVFAYTIDWDNNAETDEDRDLYIQFYEHATRKSSSPIRVTKDSVSDSMPQIVRRAGKTESYVFWKRDGGLSYFNLTDLVKEGLDTSSGNIEVEKDLLTDGVLLYEAADDGSQAAEDTGSSQTSDDTEEYDTSETGGYAYAFHAFTVDALSESETENNSFSAYQTAVDEKDNLYIVWIANATDELADGQTMTSQEIFATAMVDSAVVRDDEGVEITSLKRWAPANRLTHTGSYCDEPALALTKGGEMLLVYNNYDLTADKEIGTGENEGRVRFSNVKTTNMKLKASRMKAVGSIGVADMEVSDTTPAAGEDITVSMRFTNRGLTASKNGFTADIYEVKGNEKKHLTTYTFKEGLAPADWVNYSFTWQAAEDTVGSHVLVEVKEADIDGICGTAESEVFEKKAQYHIINARYYQGADANFYADVTVENEGNAASAEGDLLTLNFAGPYQSKEAYGIEKEIYASEKVALKAGQTKNYEAIPLEIPAAAFDVIGRLHIEAGVKTKDGYTETDRKTGIANLSAPAGFLLNAGKTIKMAAGDTHTPSISYLAGTLNKKLRAIYESSDPEIVSVEGGKLVAKSEGTATITGRLLPYGTKASVEVQVSGNTTESAVKKPGTTKVTGLVSYKKGQVNIQTKKVTGATGNQIQLATNKTFTKNVKKKTVKSGKEATFTGLGTKTWYVRSRAYKKSGSTVSYGAYSQVKKFTLKSKKRPGVIKASGVKLSAAKAKLTVTWKKEKGVTGARIIVSTDKKGKKVVYDALVTKKKVTVKKLKRKKTYYVTVRSYKKYTGNLSIYAVKGSKAKKAKTK